MNLFYRDPPEPVETPSKKNEPDLIQRFAERQNRRAGMLEQQLQQAAAAEAARAEAEANQNPAPSSLETLVDLGRVTYFRKLLAMAGVTFCPYCQRSLDSPKSLPDPRDSRICEYCSSIDSADWQISGGVK